jgi:single stranded DNA-binding protein
MNDCRFIGRFTADPVEHTFEKDGKTSRVVNYSLAINRRFKKADGESGQNTIYLRFETWDSAGAVIMKYFKKGDPILVYAEAKPEQYEKDGVTHRDMKFRTSNFDFLPSNNRKRKSEENDSYSESVPSGASADGDGGDIPF